MRACERACVYVRMLHPPHACACYCVGCCCWCCCCHHLTFPRTNYFNLFHENSTPNCFSFRRSTLIPTVTIQVHDVYVVRQSNSPKHTAYSKWRLRIVCRLSPKKSSLIYNSLNYWCKNHLNVNYRIIKIQKHKANTLLYGYITAIIGEPNEMNGEKTKSLYHQYRRFELIGVDFPHEFPNFVRLRPPLNGCIKDLFRSTVYYYYLSIHYVPLAYAFNSLIFSPLI